MSRREIRLWLLAILTLLIAVVPFTAPVTRLVYNPQAVAIDGADVTVHRTFPMDAAGGIWRPRISYVETVRPLSQETNGGHPCTYSLGATEYDRADPTGRWNIERWAAPCLDDPVGFVWRAEWSWHVGLIPLGPVRLETTVFRGSGE